MFGIGRTPSEDPSNKRSASLDGSENSERYQPVLMDQNQTVQALQVQLAELQQNLATQSKMIANLSANHHHNPPNPWDSMADYLMKQFIKSPVTIINKVNPRKPTLTFDGSNWSEWESTIN
jgi:hypothetical protein